MDSKKKEQKDRGEADEENEDSDEQQLTHIQKQAKFAQKGMIFASEAAKRLDACKREVEMMSVQLGLTLVQTRQKLQPFLDEGVVYKDRKVIK